MNRLGLFHLLILVLICAGRVNAQTKYETPGTYTWTVPPCVYEVTVKVWGAGGGGGGVIAIMRSSNDSEACAGAGGGGGGGYSSSTMAVTPGQTYTIVVGAGGTGGSSGAGTWNGGISTQPSGGATGGLSSFNGFGANIQATGGTGGGGAGSYNNNNSNDVNTVGSAGVGGNGSGGSVIFAGGNGAGGHIPGNFGIDKSGGGGGAAGPGGNGGSATHNGSVANPPGGTGQAPGGNGANGRYWNVPGNGGYNGSSGNAYGGGGGGGIAHRGNYNVEKYDGGTGAPGAVIIEYTDGAPGNPTATSPQEFCFSATVADLVATGTNLAWYSQASGGTELTPDTPLTSNTTYYVSQEMNGCESNRIPVLVIINDPAAPVVAHSNFCSGTVATLGDLTVSGTNTTWYSQANGGTSLPSTTPLVSNTTYHVSQTVGGCESDRTPVTIVIYDTPATIDAVSSATSCGQANGTITFGTVTGGTAPYQYDFNSQGLSSVTNYSDLAGGTYPVIVSDANGCTYTTSVTVPSSDAPTAVAISATPASCGNSDGSVTLGTVTGGAAPYQYDFNNQGLSANTAYANLGAGNYSLIVSDANGCTYTTSVIVPSSDAPTDIAMTTAPALCGNSDGSVTLGTVTGGAAPYQYDFNNQGLSSATSYSNLSGGTYSVIVSDVNGCTYTTSVTVTSSDSPANIAVSTTPASCGSSDGSIVLGAVTGGTAPYQYNVNNQGLSSSTTYSNLAGGTYSVVVSDANSCTYTTSVIVPSSNAPTDIVITIVPASCGASNGSVVLGAVTGGVSPYQYDFNNQGLSSNTAYSDLAGGNYPVVVSDADGCTYTTTAVVGDTPGPTAILTSVSPSTCEGANGSVVINSTVGGTSPYQYNFDNQGFSSNTQFTDLNSGVYTVSVMDDSGCEYQTTVSVNNLSSGPNAVDYTVIPGNCEEKGAVIITGIVGGTSPYVLTYNGVAAGDTIKNAASGSSVLLVTDANGCELTTVLLMPEGAGEESIHIPNVFTPNSDQINDTWFISGNCILSLECTILNRWGDVMAVLDHVTDEWNGKVKGRKAANGVYFYKAKVTYWSGKTEEYHGHITIVD